MNLHPLYEQRLENLVTGNRNFSILSLTKKYLKRFAPTIFAAVIAGYCSHIYTAHVANIAMREGLEKVTIAISAERNISPSVAIRSLPEVDILAPYETRRQLAEKFATQSLKIVKVVDTADW